MVERIRETDKKYKIDAVIVVTKSSHKAIIIGKDGRMLQRINMQASKEISEWLGKKVELSLFVKVEEDWINKKNKLYDLVYLIDKDER